MKREDLKAYDGESIYRVLECTPHKDDELHLEECFNNKIEFKFYEKAEADKVMAAYEQRIDDLEDKNRLLKIISMFNGDMMEMAERIKELETKISMLETTQKWISVNDMLPPTHKEIIGCTLKGNVMPCWFTEYARTHLSHWMPLPPPPSPYKEN